MSLTIKSSIFACLGKRSVGYHGILHSKCVETRAMASNVGLMQGNGLQRSRYSILSNINPRMMSNRNQTMVQRRNMSIASPVLAIRELLTNIHNTPMLGYETIPYWLVIVGTTVVLRSLLLPLAKVQFDRMARLKKIGPMLQAWEKTMRNQSALQNTSSYRKEYSAKVKELYKEFRCNPLQTFLLPWIQVPLWISMSLAIRYMAAFPIPFLETPLRCDAGFLYGGFGPWTDIHLPDPTWFFPIAIGAAHLSNVQLMAKTAITTRQKIWLNLFRALALVSVPIVTQIPSALSFFWLTSSLFSLVQNLYFRRWK